MPQSLENLFEGVIPLLPTSIMSGQHITLSKSDMPISPALLTTDQIIFIKAKHSYSLAYGTFTTAFNVDRLYCEIQSKTSRCLGLLILSLIMHGEPTQVKIALDNPRSQITTLVVDITYPAPEDLSDFITEMTDYNYFPSLTVRHPWIEEKPDVYDLPCFYLASEDIMRTDKPEMCEMVAGFGSKAGSAKLAELLLNAALLENIEIEYQLEGEAGFRGVGVQSAEITINLSQNIL